MSVYYIIEMTNECNHPNDKIVLTQEGEYVCSACGIVLTLDQASERRVYIQPEAIGYIDPHGKTNPWLLGLGSVISSGYIAKIAKKRNVTNDHDSKFANIIIELELERYGQELMDAYRAYVKSKRDYAIASYLAIMRVVYRYGLDLDSNNIRDVVNMYYGTRIRLIPSVLVPKISRVARRYGARRAYQVLLSDVV